jgi:16S rRNA (cytosine967-C5)-methyltransferase
VGADDAYANLALPAILRERGLDGRDAGFATELAFGTLRWRGLLDAVLARCVDRPLDQVDPSALDLLRLGTFQLLQMRVPAHAAVGETVSLARDVRGEGVSRLVNAVLRKVAARDRDAWLAEVSAGAADETERLALTTSHPAWVVSALRDSLGRAGGLDELLAVDNEPPSVTLAARPGRCTPDELLAAADVVPGRWSPYAAVLRSGPPGDLPMVRSGAVGVQDEGSQLVALALAAAPVLPAGGPETCWLDLCAGPGGKAALLAGLAAERGISYTAVDVTPHRADLVRQALAGAPGLHEVVVADGTDPRWATGSYDRVLVDAPCTGLGVLRRRPEARWRRTLDDVSALSRLQRTLLRRALTAVRPGGVVAYATCSPHLAETTVVVDDVLRSVPGVERLDAWETLPQLPRGEGPDVRLWPHVHGTDGMYVALLRRAPGASATVPGAVAP